jgi:hypothetical protein
MRTLDGSLNSWVSYYLANPGSKSGDHVNVAARLVYGRSCMSHVG